MFGFNLHFSGGGVDVCKSVEHVCKFVYVQVLRGEVSVVDRPIITVSRTQNESRRGAGIPVDVICHRTIAGGVSAPNG
jgi:hypothetical protein